MTVSMNFSFQFLGKLLIIQGKCCLKTVNNLSLTVAKKMSYIMRMEHTFQSVKQSFGTVELLLSSAWMHGVWEFSSD
jgi:hypothetical protein